MRCLAVLPSWLRIRRSWRTASGYRSSRVCVASADTDAVETERQTVCRDANTARRRPEQQEPGPQAEITDGPEQAADVPAISALFRVLDPADQGGCPVELPDAFPQALRVRGVDRDQFVRADPDQFPPLLEAA